MGNLTHNIDVNLIIHEVINLQDVALFDNTIA